MRAIGCGGGGLAVPTLSTPPRVAMGIDPYPRGTSDTTGNPEIDAIGYDDLAQEFTPEQVITSSVRRLSCRYTVVPGF